MSAHAHGKRYLQWAKKRIFHFLLNVEILHILVLMIGHKSRRRLATWFVVLHFCINLLIRGLFGRLPFSPAGQTLSSCSSLLLAPLENFRFTNKETGAIEGVWHINGVADDIAVSDYLWRRLDVEAKSAGELQAGLVEVVDAHVTMAWGYWTAHSLAPRWEHHLEAKSVSPTLLFTF